MVNLKWKVVFLGSVLTLVIVVATAFVASELTGLGLRGYLSTNFVADFPNRSLENSVYDYFKQPQWVALNVLLIALAYAVSGILTARIAGVRFALHAALAAVPAAIIFLSIWSPLFIGLSSIGGLVAKRMRAN